MERNQLTSSSLLFLTIEKAQEGLQSGQYTSVDLVKAYLARIEESSEFHAVLQTNPDALTAALELDKERVQSGIRGPLHGIPILVKDNIATKDRLDVSAGSYALLGAKPANESSVISKLRKAGALILGKTNLSEWANFRGLSISSGWSPRGGQTMGTYHPNSTPEGSSSGSAVATALGLCTAALGSETFGSILEPAEFNNVVGFKPTRGLVANDGVIPTSSRQDVIGSLTRTVIDAAYLLSSVAGRSNQDERTWNIPFDEIPDFTTFCKGTDLTGISIGVPRNSFDADPKSPIMVSFETALETLCSTGANIVDSANFPAADDFRKLNNTIKGIVRSSEFKRDIVRYIQTLDSNPNNIQSAEDIIEFTKSYPAEEYPDKDIGKFLWTQAEGIDVDSEKFKHMVEQEYFFGGEGGILGAMEKYGIDLLVVPSSLGIANDLAAKMGFPAMTVPLGFYPDGTPIKLDSRKPNLVKVAPGMPYSMTLISKAYSDAVLFQVAYAFEQLAGVRENGPLPYIFPKTELEDIQEPEGKICEVLGISGDFALNEDWEICFESLDAYSHALLGVLSFIDPDGIPEGLFGSGPIDDLPAPLSFNPNEFRFSKAIENLLALALIKTDKVSRKFSLSRLVQTSFKSFMTPEQRQAAFNDATILVSKAFPRRDSNVATLYLMWERCALYLQHVISLKDCFRLEKKSSPAFTVLQTYCDLNNACQRYLLEINSLDELADLVEINTLALSTLPEEHQTIALQGSLTSHRGQLLVRRGRADEGLKWLRKSYEIRSYDVPFNPRESGWAAENAATGIASSNDFAEAMKWYEKACKHFREWSTKGEPEQKWEYPPALMTNMAMCLTWSGQSESARIMLTKSLAQVESTEPYNWALAAFTHFGLGTIERHDRSYELSQSHFIEAHSLWLKGGQMRSHPFHAACKYRLGCIALDRGQLEAAIKNLQDALFLTEGYKNIFVAEYARCLFKLSEALEQEPSEREVARRMLNDAKDLLQQRYQSHEDARTESTYDALIYIPWR